MLHRARADGPTSADRVAGLLAPVRGGWLPPAEAGAPDRDDPEPRFPDRDDLEPVGFPGPDDPEPVGFPGSDDRQPVGPVGSDDLERSWSPAGRQDPSTPGRSLRWDVGRGGVAALLVVAALGALVAAGVVLRGRPQAVPAPVLDAVGTPLPGLQAGAGSGAPAPATTGAAPAPTGEVVVAVAGAVRSPGLVRLPAGSRVDDAVRAAGGPVEPTSTGLLNLARVLVDGEQVLVGVELPPGAPPPGAGPGAAGPGATGPGAAGSSAAGGRLDLNTATVAELDGLPGIGPVLAQRIVDWRSENGRFASVEQLREVTGIGEATFEELRDAVAV